MANSQSSNLRKFNNALSVVVVILGLYLIIWPFIPKINFWWKNTTHSNPPLVKEINTVGKKNGPAIPAFNTLIIPAIHLQETVYDGSPYPSLAKGVWHSPQSSTPPNGSNTVIAGHRFTYRGYEKGASTFYDLDKLKTGDDITLFWNKQRYDYKVSGSRVVQPTDLSIQKASNASTLTLYTCTPLWTSLERLVVSAILIKEGA